MGKFLDTVFEWAELIVHEPNEWSGCIWMAQGEVHSKIATSGSPYRTDTAYPNEDPNIFHAIQIHNHPSQHLSFSVADIIAGAIDYYLHPWKDTFHFNSSVVIWNEEYKRIEMLTWDVARWADYDILDYTRIIHIYNHSPRRVNLSKYIEDVLGPVEASRIQKRVNSKAGKLYWRPLPGGTRDFNI